MDIKELRSKKTDELTILLKDLKKESFSLRFQKIYGQLTDLSRVKKVKISIARVLTLINQKKVEENNA